MKALFLDRDGVINKMVKYDSGWDSPKRPEDTALVPGLVEIIKTASKKSLMVIEITNRPEVAKGWFSQKTSDAIEKQIHKLLLESGVKIDKTYACPHHPNGVVPELTKECECRKPKPGLLLQAAKELNIDLTKSIFLGDKDSDVQTGQAVGCKTIIFLHDEDVPEKVEKAKDTPADYKITSLSEAIPILNQLP